METLEKFLQEKSVSEKLAFDLNEIINNKLEIACKICDISEADLIFGKKHINKVEEPGKISYIYAEKKICLLVVKFSDPEIEIKWIRRFIYYAYKILEILKLR